MELQRERKLIDFDGRKETCQTRQLVIEHGNTSNYTNIKATLTAFTVNI